MHTDPSESKHIVIDARNRAASGVGRYSDRLLEHLQKLPETADYRFTVLLRPGDVWQPVSANFTAQVAPYPQFSFNPLHELGFARQLRTLKPDLVHFTMTQQPLTYFGRIICTTHDLTMLRFVRAGKTPMPIFWLKKIGYKLLFSSAHRKANRVLVPSQFVADDLGAYYPYTRGKTTVTYEASEPPILGKAQKPDAINEPFILHVGSPFPHKNLFRLIEAFEKLQETHPKLQLVLAGKKEFYFTELEEWTKKRPSYTSIHFTGFIEDAELKWLYQNAEAYVLPALSEGFGLPGLEAMAHGCAVISSDTTCLPEIYGEAAQFFNPLDVDAMTAAIAGVLDNKTARQSLINAGYERLNHYSWTTMAQQTLDAYMNILHGNN